MNDSSIMPFGKYKGKRLIDVPPSYLIWYQEEFEGLKIPELIAYIEENKQALLQEAEPKRPS